MLRLLEMLLPEMGFISLVEQKSLNEDSIYPQQWFLIITPSPVLSVDEFILILRYSSLLPFILLLPVPLAIDPKHINVFRR